MAAAGSAASEPLPEEDGVMRESIHLGTIRGIRIGLNWSLLVVFWLIAWSLAGSQLPHGAPGYARVAYWLAALVATLVFYACLLAHELAHAIVARRFGMRVEGIVLWLFGGVSKLRGDAPRASVELRMAAAGPATSLALGVGFLAVTRLLGAAGVSSLASAVTGWLGWVNALLAGFNLLPAFPLDGGRVLRGVLWQRHGDRTRATRSAARAGQAFGYLLIAFGIWELFGGAGLGGLWLVLLGWFLVGAARAEQEVVTMQARLAGLLVADAMTPNPVVVPADASVAGLVEHWLSRYRQAAFPVVDADGAVMGLVTPARVKRVPVPQRPYVLVRAIACPLRELVVSHPDAPLGEVVWRLAASREQQGLVMEGGHLVGMLSVADVTRAIRLAELTTPARGQAR
jgi:Zn-dependent protease